MSTGADSIKGLARDLNDTSMLLTTTIYKLYELYPLFENSENGTTMDVFSYNSCSSVYCIFETPKQKLQENVDSLKMKCQSIDQEDSLTTKIASATVEQDFKWFS